MRNVKCILAVTAVSLLLLSCGSDDDTSTSGSGLEGTWEMTDSRGMTNTETYTQDTLTRVSVDSDSNVKYISTMTYSTGDAAANPSGAKKIDMTVIDITMTCLTDIGVNAANSSSFYGYSDWKINVPKTIAGRKQDPSDDTTWSRNQVIYSIYKIDGNSFYHGDSSTGDESSDSKRPTALESTPYARQ